MDIGIIFGQMLVLMAMMLTGAFVYKKKWLGEEGSANISKLVVNVFNPLLVIGGVLGDTDAISHDKIVGNLQLVVLYYVIAIIFGILLAWVLHPPKNLKSIYVLMATFSNLGFMGIPVAKSLYGSEGVVYVSFYILLYNVIVYTYGMSLARRAALEKKRQGQRRKGKSCRFFKAYDQSGRGGCAFGTDHICSRYQGTCAGCFSL